MRYLIQGMQENNITSASYHNLNHDPTCSLASYGRPRTYPNPGQFRLYEDSLPALAQLAEHNWTHALITNHVPELASILRWLELEGRFARIFNSAQTGYEKPHPLAFRLALEAFNKIQSVWMIGDSLEADILGAENAGLQAVLVRKPHPAARLYCQDLTVLIDFLDK